MRKVKEKLQGRVGDLVISWVWVGIGIQIRQVMTHRNSVALGSGNKQASFCLLRARRRITLLSIARRCWARSYIVYLR